MGASICGAARPTPPATWDVASQIAPHGAGRSNRKRKHSNAFSSATPVFRFKIVSALRGAHNGSGPATAGVWGRRKPPYPNRILCKTAKPLCPKGHRLGCTSHVAGGVGRAAPQNKPPTFKNLCASFPNILSCFFNVFCTFFMPARASLGMQHPMLPGVWGEQPHKMNTRISTRARHNLGLNALRLRGGMGAA